ncbi:MAG TPA: hypothetical protein VIM64_07160, partial [Puia sp.]
MTPAKPAVYCLALAAMLFLYFPASCQNNRWVLSFNPFGLLEPKAAVGVGVGLAFNRHWELWSETSRLQHIFLDPEGTSGIRQILQLKYFIHGLPDNFLAAEMRYKGSQYTHTGRFYDAAINVSQSYPLTEHQRFWGTALQSG